MELTHLHLTKPRIFLVLFIAVTCLSAFFWTNSSQDDEMASDLPPPRAIGKFLLSKLPIYRQNNDGTFQIDASAIVELARQISVRDSEDSVSFDENDLYLTVTLIPATPEKCQRIDEVWKQIDRMNRLSDRGTTLAAN
jgi:hypothetical protein